MKKMHIAVLLLVICLLACPLNAMAVTGQNCTEPMTGSSFTIIDGWTLSETEQSDGETSYVIISDDYSYVIVYTCADMYSASFSMAGISRSDINNDFFSIDDVATEVFSTDPRNVSMSTFGNAEFFFANLDAASSGQGMHMCTAMNYTDGYMHLLMYMGDDDARLFDFYTMANTIHIS